MEQCLVPNRWNFRYHAVSTETVPAGCTRLRLNRNCGAPGQPQCCPPGSPPNCNSLGDQCPNYLSVMDNVIATRAAQAGENAADYIHVIFVNSLAWWENNAWNENVDGRYPGGGRRWILVQDNLTAWEMSMFIAHELGHAFGLCHVDDSTCSDFMQNNDCNQPRRDHNLMCGEVGRELVGAQCTKLGASTRFRDWN